MSLGWKPGLVRSGPASFEFGGEARRREAGGGSEPVEHGAMLRGTMRW